MFPPSQILGQGLSSPGTPRVPPGPPEIHPVNWPTSSGPNFAAEPPSSAHRRPPISLPKTRFQPPVELWKTEVVMYAESPPLPEMSYINYDIADESVDLSNLGSAEGTLPISLKQTEFSLKQFSEGMGQANCSVFDRWRKVWVAGSLEKKHQSVIWGQIHLKQVQDGPLHWEPAVAHCLETFENWLPLDALDNAEWIHNQWVEMCLKKRASEIWTVRKNRRRGKK